MKVLLEHLAALVAGPRAVVRCGCGHDPSRLSVESAARRGAVTPSCRGDRSTVQVDLHRASRPRGDTAAKEVLVLRPNGALQLQAKR